MRSPHLIVRKDMTLFKGRFIKVIKRPFKNTATGKKNMWWEVAKRNTFGRSVAVVAVTHRKEVVLIKTYRVPLKSWIIEPCAGLMDKRGVSEKSLARRELLEETGYRVDSLREIMSGPFNAGLAEDEIVYFLGIGARKVQKPKLEDGEDIEVITVPLSKLRSLLQHPPRGVKVDVKLFGILPFVEHI